ncbi:MAG: alanine racemase [Sphingomonadaceae bacterium]
MPRPIRATISAGALARNLERARRAAGTSKLWAVVKANAYGHGLLRAAEALAAADGFALLDFEEAIRLRLAGVKKPLLLLEGFFQPQDVTLLAEYALTPVIHAPEQLEMLRAARFAGQIDVYLKVNSGMNRLGFGSASGVGAAWRALKEHARVREVSLMTHFADADGPSGVRAQLGRFEELAAGLQAPRSLANSAALLRYPESRADWARPGIMLYGCSPFADQSATALGLEPAMTLATQVIGVQTLKAGERLGYGFSFEAAAPMRVGVLACGYADGYPRHAPSGAPVLVNGRRTRIVGRVSMDMICVDLTDMPQAGVGAPATLWGEGLPADEVAAAAGTLSYELLCALAPRVPVTERA